MKNLGVWVLTGAALLVAGAVSAAESWQPFGLEEEDVWALAASPNGVVLAGTVANDNGSGPGKVWRLEGNGSWAFLGQFAEGIWDLEFDPTDDSVVYIALNGGGVYKSVDGGVTWSWSNLTGQIWEIAISPSNPSVLYVASQTGGIYKSVDGGASWQNLAVLGNATAVAVHPADPDIALAGSPFENEGLFKTTDGGQTWANVKLGPIRSVHFYSQNPSVLFAGEMWDGIFKSLDGGNVWYKPDPGLFATVEVIREFEGTLYLNNTFDDNANPAYRSSDGGETWEPLPRQLVDRFFPRTLAVTSDHVLLGTSFTGTNHNGGVYRWDSDDPLDLTAELIADVIALNLQNGVTSSLDAKMDAVLDSLQDMNQNNDVAAIGSLGAFINAVEAQRGKKIPESDADALIAAAQAIIDLLEAS